MTIETQLLKLLAVAALVGIGASAAWGATVTLQQGVGGYAGCKTQTIWGKGIKHVTSPARLFLRGANNRFAVKFDLPASLSGKKVARARLMLFLPAASKPNMFTEIFCREITAAGAAPVLDAATKYANGRPAGAVDSVELYAPPHKNWLPYPWLELGVPAGGRWIEFNVTSLVDKWLADPNANHGVMLIPTSCPDTRFKSTWEIDIPSAAFTGDAAKRPKLVVETAPVKQDMLVGVTHSMRRICDRSTMFTYRGQYGGSYKMSMAANEFEAMQVVVYPMLADLKDVKLSFTDLKASGGKTIPAKDIEYFLVDWYK
ncbi:hypothetical protein LCGC14_2902070, partial [marine sediment metagenome]